MPRPRLPIHRTEMPLKRNAAVAPAALDCMAVPPLHPQLESLCVHAPVNVTVGPDSSTRPEVGSNGGVSGAEGLDGPLPPPPPQDATKPASNRAGSPGMKRFMDSP